MNTNTDRIYDPGPFELRGLGLDSSSMFERYSPDRAEVKENMEGYLRRGMTGLRVGFTSSLALALTLEDRLFGIIPGILIGLGYGIAFRPAPGAYLDSIREFYSDTYGFLHETQERSPLIDFLK